MYLIESKVEMLEKEQNAWVYDIENIKLNKEIQVRILIYCLYMFILAKIERFKP